MPHKCSVSNTAEKHRPLIARAAHLRTIAVLIAILLPSAAWAQVGKSQPAPKKSAEEILKGLLGGTERGRGGRGESGAANDERADRPHIAVPIHFGYDSADITPDSFAQLHQVAQALNNSQLTSSRIGIEGHTDNHGPAGYNRALSQRRADAVRRFLVEEEGVAASRLVAEGYGKSRPLPGVSQDTEKGRAANRRVEFVNLGTLPAADQVAVEPPEASPLSVHVVVTYKRGSETHVLTSNGVLTPRDNYQITFTPNRNSYVYIYRIDSRGQGVAAFPNRDYSPETNPTEAQRTYVVPAKGDWFGMDQHQGKHEIIVLAAPNPLRDPMALARSMWVSPLSAVVRGPASGVRPDVKPDIPAGVFSYRLPFENR